MICCNFHCCGRGHSIPAQALLGKPVFSNLPTTTAFLGVMPTSHTKAVHVWTEGGLSWEGVSRSRPRLTISFWTGGQDEISIRLRGDLAPSCSVKALNFELTLQARKTQAAFSGQEVLRGDPAFWNLPRRSYLVGLVFDASKH